MKKLIKTLLILIALLIISIFSFYLYRKFTQKTIAILLYENFTMLDVVGAYQTFPGLSFSNYKIKYVAAQKGAIPSNHIQSLEAQLSFEELTTADILYIPGGESIEATLGNEQLIKWIQQIDRNSEYTLAVGSGVLLLGQAGLLKQKKATVPWHYQKYLESFEVAYQNENYVIDGKYYTGKGAAASIDMVLDLIGHIAGPGWAKAMQLFIEYDPFPPVQSGYTPQDSLTQNLANYLLQNNDYQSDTSIHKREILILLYEGFTMLDLVGPYQVFKELAPLGYEMKFVANQKGQIKSDGALALQAAYDFQDNFNPDILFIPGGTDTPDAMLNPALINWVKKIDQSTKYSTSVCTGSFIYAKAGLLKNRQATTHWYAKKFLKDYEVTFSNTRYHRDGKYITGAGVSSGIDLALLIVKEVISETYAKAIQLKIGYHPHPPFDAGAPSKADPNTLKIFNFMLSAAEKRYVEARDK
jgi:transcriptional regulator GlxA family with amidase domain